MKILLINKFYYLKGGAERYFFSLKELLEDAGHEVIPFAMSHPSNVRSSYAKYFVSRVDLEKAVSLMERHEGRGPRYLFRSKPRLNSKH